MTKTALQPRKNTDKKLSFSNFGGTCPSNSTPTRRRPTPRAPPTKNRREPFIRACPLYCNNKYQISMLPVKTFSQLPVM